MSSVPCVAAASTELSTPGRSTVTMPMPHLEALKGALLGQHRSESCPGRLSRSTGASQPVPMGREGSGEGVAGAAGHVGQQPNAPSMGIFETL